MTEGAMLTQGPIERYRPRALVPAETWQIGSTRFKVYGLLAEGKDLTPGIMGDAERFVRQDVTSAIEREGAENGAGFVIVHPGDLGVPSLRIGGCRALCCVSVSSGPCTGLIGRWM